MATTVRKFGTVLTNIKQDKKQVGRKQNLKAGVDTTSKKYVQKIVVKEETPVLEKTVEEVATPPALETLEVPLAQKEELPCLAHKGELVYSREFLLSFKDKFTQPLEGLLAEVCLSNRHVQKKRFENGPKQFVNKVPRKDIGSFRAGTSVNGGVELAQPVQVAETPLVETKSDIELKEEIIPELRAPSPEAAEATQQQPDSLEATAENAGQAIAPTNVKLEWKPKKVKKPKKEKPKESDARRLAARQKQIDIGMNTAGYKRYLEMTPSASRKKSDPKTPDKFQVCSKRSWDGQVRKWRRQLHLFDPPGVDSSMDGLEQLDENEELEQAEALEQVVDEDSSKKKLVINLNEIFANLNTGVVV